mgnify:CR=1 FL=1
MNDFILYTDSACDLPEDMLKSLGIHYRSLTFAFEGESEHGDREVPAKDFYAKMRAGGVAKTAAINTECFREAFEEEIAAGHDILYIAFSSGLSTTYNSGRFALADLKDKYPDRKLIAVDSLCCDDPGRLYRTVQLTDAGITPGSGAAAPRRGLSERSAGIPVIAVGVPSAALLSSITGDQAHQRFLAAPSDEDVQSLIWADCIAAAISAVIR